MNGSSTPLPDEWLSRLGGVDASGWLTAFHAEADTAVSELLWNRFYFGPLNLIERGQLLATWLESIGEASQFAPRLDSALAGWVEKNWGRFDHPAVTMVSAWTCLASVIEFSAKLPKPLRLSRAASALRKWFPLRERFLGSFSTAPAADPLGTYLAVIAEFQGDDRSLAGFWQRLCNLPDGVPFYHARYAILGLRRLKSANIIENGSLRAEVVLGMFRLANAFDRLVRERGLSEQIAQSNFRRVGVQLAVAYPDSPLWVDHGLHHLLDMPERPKRWVLEAIHPLAAAVRRERTGANQPHTQPRRPSIQADPDWANRAGVLVKELNKDHIDSLLDVERLLNEQRRYAEATGDTYFIVRSLCNFASRILRLRPEVARRWAEEARSWEPHDPYTWAVIKDVLLGQRNIARALSFAWVAWKRFPEDVVARNGLAEVLKRAGSFPEAEEIYRQTIDLFPEDVVTRNGLADVLKKAGSFPEAEKVYRQTIDHFPEEVVARNGLADTLRRIHHWAEAEAVYRESIAAGYVDSATFIGLAYLLLRKGEASRTEALSLVDEALRLNPRDSYAPLLIERLRPANAVDLVTIADEWESVVDELFRVSGAAVEDASTASESDVDVVRCSKPAEQRSLRFSVFPVEDSGSADLEPLPAVVSPLPVDSLEVAALVAEAQFYRIWSARSSADLATSRRQTAATLLTRAETLLPHDSQVTAEKAALECHQGYSEQTMQSLRTQLGNYPGAAPLLVLKARLDREAAQREHRQLNNATLADLLQAPNRLRNLDPVFLPVFYFEKGLAALALMDGAVRSETAATSFTNFRRTVARRATEEKAERESSRAAHARNGPRFHEWLRTTTNQRLFGGVQDPETVRVDDVPRIEQSLTENPSAFGEVEENIVDRLAYAGV